MSNSQITDAVTQIKPGALDAADVEIVADPNFIPQEVEVPADLALDKDEDAHS